MKKLFPAVAVFISLFVLFGYFSHVFASTWVDSSFNCQRVALDTARGWTDCLSGNDEIEAIVKSCEAKGQVNMEGYSSASLDSLSVNIAGKILGVNTFCKGDKLKDLYSSSAIGTTTKLIGGMYNNPPASSVYFAQDLLQNAGFAKPVYAQGIGYSGLKPLLPIWKAFRNLSYVIIVFVLVIVGFMVMFRMKIDAQTVVNIQNALPNIVVTLILITFSYAIAGLLIDLMYFAIMVIVSFFAQSGLASNLSQTGLSGNTMLQDPGQVQALQTRFINANAWTLIQSLFKGVNINALPGAISGPGFKEIWEDAPNAGGVIAGTIVKAIGFIGSIIVWLLVAIAIFFSFVRIFFILLNSYVQIILAVILGPLQLLLGAIPGRNAVGNWIMGLVGNLLVFPTLVAIIMLGNSFPLVVRGLKTQTTEPNMWIAPFVAGPQTEASLVVGLISFGLLMLAPSILTAVKGAFAPKPALPVSPGMLLSPLSSTLGTIGSIGQSRYYLKQTPIINKLPGIKEKSQGPSQP